MTERVIVFAYIHIINRPSDPTKTILKIAKLYSDKKLIIRRDSHGKLYFVNEKKLHFNISHSGVKWAIAFSTSPVGIDIEKFKPRNFEKIVSRIGTKKEKVLFHTSKHPRSDFYSLWTRKEAITKCIGQGFKYGFEKIECKKWNVKTYKAGNFILSVASKNRREKFRIVTSSTSLTFRPIP